MFVVCEKWVEARTDWYIEPSSFSPRAALLSHLRLGCSTGGHWGPQSPQSASWFSPWHPVSDWLEVPRHLVILFSNIHLLPLFFSLFTQVNLLIKGLVEGQFITTALIFLFLVMSMAREWSNVLENYYFIPTHVYIEFTAKTAWGLKKEKQAETFQKDSKNTKETLNQVIFPMHYLFPKTRNLSSNIQTFFIAFIHDQNMRRIRQSSTISHDNTIEQWPGF